MVKMLKSQMERLLSFLQQKFAEDVKELPLPRLEVSFTPQGTNLECIARLVTGHIKGETISSLVLWRTALDNADNPIVEGIFLPSRAPHFFSCDVAFLSGHLGVPVYVTGVAGTHIRWTQTSTHPHQLTLGEKSRRAI